MADRLLTITVTGFTPAGYEISAQALDVKPDVLEATIVWFDAKLLALGVRSVCGRENGKGQPVMNEDGAHTCKIHGVDMVRHEKGESHWFSHQLEDGSWCRGKAAKK